MSNPFDFLPDPLGIFGEKTGPFESSRRANKKAADRQAALLESLKEKPEPVPVMPLPDDDATRRARRRSLAEQRRRGGRASTMLADQPILSDLVVSDTLG